MKPPLLLFIMTLTLWGACAEMLWFGALLGIFLEIIQFGHLERSFANQDLNRVVDLAALLSSGSATYFIFSAGIAEGLLKTIVWLPIAMLPIILVQIISAGSFRFRNLFYSLRRSISPLADQTAYLFYPYLLLVLISASVATTNYVLFVPSALIFSAYALFTIRPRDHAPRIWLFLIIFAFSIGLGLAWGLNRLQALIEDSLIEWFAAAPPNPYHTRTRIGDVGQIKLSDTIIWRIQLDYPLFEPFLLIDSIYTSFDGNTWRALHDIFRTLNEPQNGEYFIGKPIAPLATLNINGYSEDGQALLPLPGASYSIKNLGASIISVNSLGVVKISDAAPLMQLQITYTPELISRLPPTIVDMEIPNSLASLFARLRNSLNRHGQSDADIVATVVRFFHDNFRYSLFLGNQSGGKTLSDFLTNARSGHCEYFATATTLLLRSFGIPARYITGYSVQEFSPSEGQYVARRRHAHAWSQAYINGVWQNIDTTPAIWRDTEDMQNNSLLQPVLDWFSWRWYRYNEWRAHNQNIFSGYWLISAGGLLFAWFYWRLLRRPKIQNHTAQKSQNRQLNSSPQPYMQMEEKLAQAGYFRPLGETPRHWIQNLIQTGCPYITRNAEDLVYTYYVFRFRPQQELSGRLEQLGKNWQKEIHALGVR